MPDLRQNQTKGTDFELFQLKVFTILSPYFSEIAYLCIR